MQVSEGMGAGPTRRARRQMVVGFYAALSRNRADEQQARVDMHGVVGDLVFWFPTAREQGASVEVHGSGKRPILA
jgi:hypothetical protein